jgi:hypothetical protein
MMVELDDDLVIALQQVLDESNAAAAEWGFAPWTLDILIRDMIWDEMKRWQRNHTIGDLKRLLCR